LKPGQALGMGGPPVAPKREKPGRWRYAALLVAFSGPISGLMAFWNWPLAFPIAVHILGTLGARFLWRNTDSPAEEQHPDEVLLEDQPGERPAREAKMLALQAWTLVLCFPVIGSAAAWMIFGRAGKVSTALLDSYQDYIAFERTAPRHRAKVADRDAALSRELAVLPLRDQLDSGDLAAKQGAAARLLEFADGERVLREALLHPADETRLFASLALVRRQEAMFARLRAAREAVREEPNLAQPHLELAAAAAAYAEGGAGNPRLAAAFWQESEREARVALTLELDPAESAAAWLMVGRARSALGDLDTALEAVENALALSPRDVEAALSRCELLFRLERHAELPRAAAVLSAVAEKGSEAADAAAFWIGSGHGR
jgi:hypothetical protein